LRDKEDRMERGWRNAGSLLIRKQGLKRQTGGGKWEGKDGMHFRRGSGEIWEKIEKNIVK
jgi:hypothetical protein